MNKTDFIVEHLKRDPNLSSKQLAQLTNASLGHARRTRGRFLREQKKETQPAQHQEVAQA